MKNILNKIKQYRAHNIFNFYIIALFSSYALWKAYKLLIYSNSLTLQNLGVKINFAISELYIVFISKLLSVVSIGHTTFITNSNYGTYPAISLEDNASGGVFIAYHCIGVTVFFVYTLTIWLLNGSIKRKLLYSVVGIFIIFVVNATRILAALFLTKYASQKFFDINHSFVFVVLTYSTVFLIHLFYLKKYLKKASEV